jgi:Tfp pilus assembly protein PilF
MQQNSVISTPSRFSRNTPKVCATIAHLLHTGKKELDKAEELFKKALQAEPHRAPTLFNNAAYLLKRGQVICMHARAS